MRDQKQTKIKKIKHIVSFEGVKILKSFTNCEWSTPQDSQWDIFLGDFFAAKTRWNIILLNSRITCELMWSVAGHVTMFSLCWEPWSDLNCRFDCQASQVKKCIFTSVNSINSPTPKNCSSDLEPSCFPEILWTHLPDRVLDLCADKNCKGAPERMWRVFGMSRWNTATPATESSGWHDVGKENLPACHFLSPASSSSNGPNTCH